MLTAAKWWSSSTAGKAQLQSRPLGAGAPLYCEPAAVARIGPVGAGTPRSER